MDVSEQSQLLHNCAQAAKDLSQKNLIHQAWLFGSLIYRDGSHFDPASSDIDILLRFRVDCTEPLTRTQAIETMSSHLRALDRELLQSAAMRQRKSVLSANVFGSFVWNHGLFNWTDPLFQKRNRFLDLLTSPPYAFTRFERWDGHKLMRDKYADATHSLVTAHTMRKRFLSDCMEGDDADSVRDKKLEWTTPVSKELQRASARLSAFYNRAVDDASAYDVNLGMKYLEALVEEWVPVAPEYGSLRDRIDARRGLRGQPGPMTRRDELLMWEVLAYKAEDLLSGRKIRPKPPGRTAGMMKARTGRRPT